jgi:hypothetical protein
MSEKLEEATLRKVLQRFNEDLGQYINAEERYKLGRVLTIIDAAISDPEQRKAIKDLVNSEWWGNGSRPSESAMHSPYTDLRAICQLFGFELYEPTAGEGLPTEDLSWVVKRYKNQQ